MKKQTALQSISVIALILAAATYRVIVGEHGSLPNFSPMAAIILCGAVYLPWRAGLLIPAVVLLLSDAILDLHFNEPIFNLAMVVRYAFFGLLAGMGLLLARNPRALFILAGSVAGSVAFYLVTNTVSWLTIAGYPMTFAGWVQSLTTGLPDQQPQTWVFFRNSFVSDIFFTAVILVCVSASREKESSQPALATN